MKLAERRFRKDVVDVPFWDSSEIRVCCLELSMIFDIPDNVKTIWISLHDRASVSRLIAKIETELSPGTGSRCQTMFFPEASLYGISDCYGSCHADKILRKFIGKTVHVQVEYELKE